MADLTIVRGGGPHTDLDRRIPTLDARVLLRRAGIEDLVDEIEVSAGRKRIFWSAEPNQPQLNALGRAVREYAE